MIGTKCDLDRKISKEEGEKIAIENNIKFFETSAKENINVNETFESLTLEILKYMEEEEKIDGNSKSVVIDRESVKEKEKKEKEKKKCC